MLSSQLQFNIVEYEEEILILDKNTRLATNILNWDAGSELLINYIDKLTSEFLETKSWEIRDDQNCVAS